MLRLASLVMSLGNQEVHAAGASHGQDGAQNQQACPQQLACCQAPCTLLLLAACLLGGKIVPLGGSLLRGRGGAQKW